ncbi:MAG TPA: SPOR domain-containing protein [Gemmatimonadaceae bacterium]|nr:SPOR domain-containing protein [Gemmatimonadaceae bacterium]
MRRAIGAAGVLALLAWADPALAQTGESPQSVDSVFAQMQNLVTAGDRGAAHVLADSLVSTLPPLSPIYAEALYWRAFTASQAAAAERDYLRVSVEYPLSPRAPEALLALAQLEYARGDRASARRRFDRLLREYPSGQHVARASYWSGTLALAAGDRVAACRSFSAARAAVAPGDVELANQIDYYVLQCTATGTDTIVSGTGRPGGAGEGGGRSAAAARAFSIQVAAFTNRSDATALASRLQQRDFDARVFGDRAPFRVRIGRYATREDAAAALARMRRAQVNGIIVEAERP